MKKKLHLIKIIFSLFIAVTLVFGFTGCRKDVDDEPAGSSPDEQQKTDTDKDKTEDPTVPDIPTGLYLPTEKNMQNVFIIIDKEVGYAGIMELSDYAAMQTYLKDFDRFKEEYCLASGETYAYDWYDTGDSDKPTSAYKLNFKGKNYYLYKSDYIYLETDANPNLIARQNLVLLDDDVELVWNKLLLGLYVSSIPYGNTSKYLYAMNYGKKINLYLGESKEEKDITKLEVLDTIDNVSYNFSYDSLNIKNDKYELKIKENLAFSIRPVSDNLELYIPMTNISSKEVFETMVQALPNVVSMKEFKVSDEDSFFTMMNNYEVIFTSKLDPFDPSNTATFTQKAIIGFHDFGFPTMLTTTTEHLHENLELCNDFIYDTFIWTFCNYVIIENRYTGESIPKEISRSDGNYDGSYWKYLNIENTVEDIHAIVTQLKTILTTPWFTAGYNHCGQISDMYALHHEEDIDLLITSGTYHCYNGMDTDHADFIFNKIGDDDKRFNQSGNAAEYRKILDDLTIWYLENRDTEYENGLTIKEQLFKDQITDKNIYHSDFCTSDSFYEEAIYNLRYDIWQVADAKNFDKIRSFLDSPGKESTEMLYEYLRIFSSLEYDGFDYSGLFYLLFTELGYHDYDFSELRKLVAEEKKKNPNSKAKITIAEGDEAGLDKKLFFSEAERALLDFDDTSYNKLKKYFETTQLNIIIFNSVIEPWRTLKMEIPKRDNIITGTHNACSACVFISAFFSTTDPFVDKCFEIIDILY